VYEIARMRLLVVHAPFRPKVHAWLLTTHSGRTEDRERKELGSGT